MSIPSLTPKVIFGHRTNVKKNAHYLTDSDVLYSCGAVLVIQNFTAGTQEYLKLRDTTKNYLQLLLLSPSRNYIAILDAIPGKGEIHIYDCQTQKRKRTLSLPPDATTGSFEWINFSYDDKYIMAITGDPDWMMLVFNWERGKIETSTKANYLTNPTAPVREVVCSPVDSSMVVIFGQGIFRLMNMQETVWRQYGFQKAENFDICSCCFLTGDRIVCGTTDGFLLLIDLGELRYIFEADVVNNINARAEKEEEFLGAVTSAMYLEKVKELEEQPNKVDKAVRALTALKNGFAFSCGPGLVHFFEKVSTHRYKKRNIYEITDKDFRENQVTSITVVYHLAVNVSETRMIATTGRSQLYEVKLWGPEMDIAGLVPFKHLGYSIHTGPIGDLALCYWKPIFMTCGTLDRTVRVWNYDTLSLELMKQYQEDVHSVSLHPTGLFSAVGFSDKLRVMVVLIDDLQVMREIPIRECQRSSFSISGHLLAAVNKNVIQIYSSVTFQNLANLRGHSNLITCLQWSTDGTKLVSCGIDGAVYEWDLNTFKRIGEIVNKGVSYNECALTSNGKSIYVVGSDHYLKEIRSSNIVRFINLQQKNMNHVLLSRSDLMMFLSGEEGWVVSIKMPIEEPPEYNTYFYHSSGIAQMKITSDDRSLITCSHMGVICIWKLENIEGRAIALDKDFKYFGEILISKTDLEEKLSTIKDLTHRTYELEMEHAYQMRHTETVYKDKIKDIQDTYNEAIDELKGTLEELEANHNTELNNIASDMNVLKERHGAEMLEMEAKYNAELIVEYDKVVNLETLKEDLTTEYESKLDALQKSKETTIEELTRINESKLYNLSKMVEEAREDINKEIMQHEVITDQIEDDNDREIETLKAKFEKLLKTERESNIRLKGESGVLKKKIASSQKEIELIQMEIITLTADHHKFKNDIRLLEEEILDLKKDISERDLRIQEKEKRIYDLKRKDQEYERYKFVLNYRIKELKNQIEPRDKEIKEKKEQISEMEDDLEDLQKFNLNLENNLTHLREKLNNVYKMLHVYRKKYKAIMNVIERVKTDIFTASGNIQDYKKLRDGVKKLYFKYITDKEFIKARQGDEECTEELNRQKTYLKEIVNNLEKEVEVSKTVNYGEGMIYMEMNWSLMDEIYKIRKKFKTAQAKICDLEMLISVKLAKIYSPRRAENLLQKALADEEDVREEFQIQLEEAVNKASMMREELESLLSQIDQLESSVHTTFSSIHKKRTKETLKFDIPSAL